MRSLSVYNLDLLADLAQAGSQVSCAVPFSGKCIGVAVATPADVDTTTTLTISRSRGTTTFVSLFASDPSIPDTLSQGTFLVFNPDQNFNLQDGDVLRVINNTGAGLTQRVSVQFFIDSDSDANPTGFNALLPGISRSLRPLSLIPWVVGVDHAVASAQTSSQIPVNCKIMGILGGTSVTTTTSVLTISRVRGGVAAALFSVAPNLITAGTAAGTVSALVPNQNNDCVEGDILRFVNATVVTNCRIGWVFLLATGEGG